MEFATRFSITYKYLFFKIERLANKIWLGCFNKILFYFY